MTELRYYDTITVAGIPLEVISGTHWRLPDGTDIVCRRARGTWGRDYEWHVLDHIGEQPLRICPSLHIAVCWWCVNMRGAA